jgi:acyl dehydratase
MSSITDGTAGPEDSPVDAGRRSGRHLATRESIRHFAVAIGAMAAVHHDVEAARAGGFRDLLAPPSYFSVMGLSLGRILPSELLRPDGIPLTDELQGRAVAGEAAVEWLGDIIAGDTVEFEERFAGSYVAAGRSGPLNCYVYHRTYSVESAVVVRERLVRIGR